jgi:surfactin synthase thioesterase subunit
MNSSILRDLVEIAALATATAGATLLFGPVALIGAGIGTIVALEVGHR